MSISVELLGWVGATLLAVCATPQACMSLRQRHSDGISMLSLILWGLGDILMLIYVILHSASAPLIFNYVANIFLMGIILFFKIYPYREFTES